MPFRLPYRSSIKCHAFYGDLSFFLNILFQVVLHYRLIYHGSSFCPNGVSVFVPIIADKTNMSEIYFGKDFVTVNNEIPILYFNKNIIWGNSGTSRLAWYHRHPDRLPSSLLGSALGRHFSHFFDINHFGMHGQRGLANGHRHIFYDPSRRATELERIVVYLMSANFSKRKIMPSTRSKQVIAQRFLAQKGVILNLENLDFRHMERVLASYQIVTEWFCMLTIGLPFFVLSKTGKMNSLFNSPKKRIKGMLYHTPFSRCYNHDVMKTLFYIGRPFSVTIYSLLRSLSFLFVFLHNVLHATVPSNEYTANALSQPLYMVFYIASQWVMLLECLYQPSSIGEDFFSVCSPSS